MSSNRTSYTVLDHSVASIRFGSRGEQQWSYYVDADVDIDVDFNWVPWVELIGTKQPLRVTRQEMAAIQSSIATTHSGTKPLTFEKQGSEVSIFELAGDRDHARHRTGETIEECNR